jgi:hypothetical protein
MVGLNRQGAANGSRTSRPFGTVSNLKGKLMTSEDRRELAKLIASQCAGIQADILNRALTGRDFTDTAINDVKRILTHLVSAIDERL